MCVRICACVYVKKEFFKKDQVHLCWRGYYGTATHGRDPTTDRHGCFWLLGFPPGPVHTSLDNLDAPGSPGVAILMPSLVRTPTQHGESRSSYPHLKPSAGSSLRVAGLQGCATNPSWKNWPRKGT